MQGSVESLSHDQAKLGIEEETLYKKIIEEHTKTKMVCCADAEVKSRLIRENPLLSTVLFSGATVGFFDQVLKLWPEFREQNLTYFTTSGAMAGGIIGFSIGARNIIHPTQGNKVKLKALAILEGMGAVFPFTMGGIIKIYCLNDANWKTVNGNRFCTTSEFLLAVEFFLPALGSGIIYTCWKMLPLKKKIDWASRNKYYYLAVNAVEGILNSFLFSRIFQWCILTFNPTIPSLLVYEVAPIAAAVTVVSIQSCNKRHREKFYTFLNAFFSGICTEVLVKDISQDWHSNHMGAFIIKVAGLGLLLISGFAITWVHSRKFIEERQVIEKYIPVEKPSLIKDQMREELIEDLEPILRKKILKELKETMVDSENDNPTERDGVSDDELIDDKHKFYLRFLKAKDPDNLKQKIDHLLSEQIENADLKNVDLNSPPTSTSRKMTSLTYQYNTQHFSTEPEKKRSENLTQTAEVASQNASHTPKQNVYFNKGKPDNGSNKSSNCVIC